MGQINVQNSHSLTNLMIEKHITNTLLLLLLLLLLLQQFITRTNVKT